MKRKKIFLASSIKKFSKERKEIGSFVQQLNETLISSGKYLDLEVCEELSNSVSSQRKQNDFNDMIRNSDVFYALLDDQIGKYTIEEYNVAYQQYKDTGKPKIKVFLKDCDESYDFIDVLKANRMEFCFYDDVYTITQNISDYVNKDNTIDNDSQIPSFVTILVALSVTDYKDDEDELQDYIRSLNDTYIDYGLFFRLQFCDNNTDTIISEIEKQVDNSSFYYIIIGNEAGKTITDSFDLAYDRFLKDNKPRIYTYFQTLPEGTVVTDEVKTFMERLRKEIAHYYSRFEHIDSIKLNMLLELTRSNNLKETIDIRDGKAVVNGSEILSLENIPVFKNNDERQKYKEEIDRLKQEKARLAVEFTNDTENMDIYRQLSETAGKYQDIQNAYHEMEKSILQMCSTIAERNSSGEPITWREKKASEYLDDGDYRYALAVLRDPEREEELKRAYEKAEIVEDEFIGYINEGMLKINTLKSQGINKTTLPEIYEEYEKCVKVSKDKLTKADVVYDYAIFLLEQNDYEKAIINAEWLKTFYKLINDSGDNTANTDILLGTLYSHTDRYNEAEKHYYAATEYYERTVKENPEKYEDKLAISYNYLADIFHTVSRFDESELYHLKSLEILGNLAKESPSLYNANLATAYNSLSLFYSDSNRNGSAVKFYKLAIKIREHLTKEDSVSFESDLATSYDKLAMLLTDTNTYHYDLSTHLTDSFDKFAEPEKYFRTAIKIREHLAEDNPLAYEGELAESYCNLALLYLNAEKYRESEKYLLKSAEIRERLNHYNPVAYEKDLAKTYYGLSLLYTNTEKYCDSRKYGLLATQIYKRLAEDNLSVYEKDLGLCYCNLAQQYADENIYDTAESYYAKTEEIKSRIDSNAPSAYDLAISYHKRENTELTNEKIDDVEKHYKSCIEILERLVSANPEAYLSDLALSYLKVQQLYYNLEKYDEYNKQYAYRAAEVRNSMSIENESYYSRDSVMLYDKSGSVHSRLFTSNKDLAQYYKLAIEFFEAMSNENPDKYSYLLSCSYVDLADLYKELYKYSESKNYYDKGICILQGLAEKTPVQYECILAESYLKYSYLCVIMGEYTTAKQYALMAADIFERLSSENHDTRYYLYRTYDNLVNICFDLHEYAAASEYKELEDEIRKQLSVITD